MHFGVWFKRTFKVNVPQVFYEHLKNNSNICDENCALYKEDEVISCTEKCDSIIDKGFPDYHRTSASFNNRAGIAGV